MKDLIKRWSVIILFGLFASYLIYYMVIGKPIVIDQYNNLNTFYYLILIAASLYIAIFYGIYPISIKFSRATLFVIGLGMIIMGKTIFLDDPLNNIYFGDISCVIGVLITIIGPTNMIMTSQVKKQKEDKNLEIIEV